MAYQELYAQDAGFGIKGSDKSNVAGANPYAIDFDAAAGAAKLANQKTIVGDVLTDAKARTPGAQLNKFFTPRMLLNEVETRVAAGAVDPRKAAEEVARFVAAQSVNSYQANKLEVLNLPQAVDWQVAAGSTGKTMVDLMNPTQLEHYFMSQVAKKKASERIGLNNPFIPFR
jgi:hypothetical protein